MTPAWKYGIVFVAFAVLWKLVLYFIGLARSQWEEYGIFLNVFLLLLAIIFTIKKVRRSAESSNQIFRKALTSGLVFTLFFSGFILIYYSFIDPTYFADKLNSGLEVMNGQGAAKEEMIKYYTTGKMMVMNPMSHALYSFFGLMFLSMLYAAVLTFLNRRNII